MAKPKNETKEQREVRLMKQRELDRKRYAANRDSELLRQKLYRQQNKESIKQQKSLYYKLNKQCFNAKNKKYYSHNREQIRTQQDIYRKINPKLVAAAQRKSRQKIKQVTK
jgi:hypothetical protein